MKSTLEIDINILYLEINVYILNSIQQQNIIPNLIQC